MMDNNFSLKEIINLEQIQRLAERFCVATNVFAYAVDGEGKPVIRLSGHSCDSGKVWEYLDKEQAKELVERVKAGSLEEQVVEQTEYVNMMAAAIAIQMKGEQVLTWIVYGVLEDRKAEPGKPYIMDVKHKLTEQNFYHVLDLLRDSSYTFFENMLSLVNVQAENVRSRNSENEAEQSLKRIEATTKIIQLLDSEEAMEMLIAEILSTAGRYLQVSSAQLYKMNRKEENMDVVSEWCREGVVSFFDKTKKLQAFSFLNQDKPLVISSDSFEGTEAGKVLTEYEVKALTAFPLQVQGADDMYLCFMDRKKRMWQVEEIKFMLDTGKLLQSMVQKQWQEDSIVSSGKAMETILDNLNGGIYIRDTETKEAFMILQIAKYIRER